MKIKKLILIALMTLPNLAFSNQYVLGIGDSLMLRSGLCAKTDTLKSCEESGKINHEVAFMQYLLSTSINNISPVYNGGRGGDTCLGKGFYEEGVNKGQPRGLLRYLKASVINKPIDTVISIIGFNDVNNDDPIKVSSVSDTADCIYAVWEDIYNRGLTPVGMTYPIPAASIWGARKSQNIVDLNAAIVAKAAIFNAKYQGKLKIVRVEKLNNSKPEDYLEDGLHPTKPFAKEIAKEVVKTLGDL
jgi:lysophospholipase L1-like esterase